MVDSDLQAATQECELAVFAPGESNLMHDGAPHESGTQSHI